MITAIACLTTCSSVTQPVLRQCEQVELVTGIGAARAMMTDECLRVGTLTNSVNGRRTTFAVNSIASAAFASTHVATALRDSPRSPTHAHTSHRKTTY